MLNNPNWGKTEADISLDDFIGWLETKDPNEAYCFDDASACAITQYAASRGVPVGGNYLKMFHKVFGSDYDSTAMLGLRAIHGPNQTFGKALRNLKALKEEGKI